MYKLIDVTPFKGSESWLIVTPERVALFDTGFAWTGDMLVKNVEKALGGRDLDYIVLTHSHYDHASGAPYCRRRWPKAQVAGSDYARYVFTRPGAIATIREMNRAAAATAGVTEYEDLCGELSVDMPLKEGDIIDLGSMRFRAVETPGHTKCCMSYMCDEESFLVCSETTGFPLHEGPIGVLPGFIIGYQVTVDSVKKVMDCAPEKLLYIHLGLLEGERCREYLGGLLYWAEYLKDDIVARYRAGKSARQIMDELVHEIYGELGRLGQPRAAFELNLSYMVPMILNECAGADEKRIEL